MSETNREYFSESGLQRFWRYLKQILDRKIESVSGKDNSINVVDKRKVGVKISPARGNTLKINNFPGEEGLYAESTIGRLEHKLVFGADREYVFDGTRDITIPVYMGEITEG